MGLDEVLADGQAQSRSARRAGATFVDAVEPFKDAFLGLFVDADAVVLDFDVDLLGLLADADGGQARAVLPTVVHGIHNQIADDLRDPSRIPDGEQGRRGGGIEDELDFRALGPPFLVVQDFLNDLDDVEIARANVEPSRFLLRNDVEVFDEVLHAFRALGGFLEELHGVLGIVNRAVDEGQDVPLEGLQRRFEFVGQVADEAPAEVVLVFEGLDLVFLIDRPNPRPIPEKLLPVRRQPQNHGILRPLEAIENVEEVDQPPQHEPAEQQQDGQRRRRAHPQWQHEGRHADLRLLTDCLQPFSPPTAEPNPHANRKPRQHPPEDHARPQRNPQRTVLRNQEAAGISCSNL